MRLTLGRYLSWQALKQPPKATTCNYKHTCTHKQMSHKHEYHTLRDMHTYILWQHAHSKRVASCQRSLREQNTTCPLIFPSWAKRDSLSKWSHLHLLSHPMLNGSLSAIFSSTIYPRLCCSFPSLLLRIWSQSTGFHAVILITDERVNVVPGVLVVMRPDDV